ncbi:YbaB/EbfC family nucleoid-associated protein [Nocardia sp. NPDC051463]|uniref:YbaB/EbfC family nucleoid-associated protein n=1 Tax=Nocardia sp. NPDC051463 TaxID=3154845 RepID=UPI003413FE05
MGDEGRAHLDRLQEALTRIRGISSWGDRSVTVEVGANGALYAVRLNEFGMHLDPQHLADRIVELHKHAMADASDLMRATVDELRAEPGMQAIPGQAADDHDEPESSSPATSAATAVQQQDAPSSSQDPAQRGRPPRPQGSEPVPAADPSDPISRSEPALLVDQNQASWVMDDGSDNGPRREDLENETSQAFWPFEDFEDRGVYAPILPGDNNPYAAVYADPPQPARASAPSATPPDPVIGAIYLSSSQPPHLDSRNPASWRDLRVSPLDDYLRYESPWDDWYPDQ